MDIKQTAVSGVAAPSTTAERLRAAFVLVLGGLAAVLRGIFLPHLLVSLGLFTLAGYGIYKVWLGPLALPFPFSWVVAGLVVGGYGAAALAYALVTSLVFSVRAAAGYAEDFFYELFASLKDKVRARIDDMDEGLAKQQARVILDNSVREVFAGLRAFRFGPAPKAVAGVLLSLLTFVTRSVFLARLARLSGTTVNFSAVFAGRATLVGALFLNMRWLASLALCLLYGAGLCALLVNIWLIW